MGQLGLGSGPHVVGRLGSGMRVNAIFQIIPRPVGRLGLGLGLGSEPNVVGRLGSGPKSGGGLSPGVFSLAGELSPGGLSPRIASFPKIPRRGEIKTVPMMT